MKYIDKNSRLNRQIEAFFLVWCLEKPCEREEVGYNAEDQEETEGQMRALQEAERIKMLRSLKKNRCVVISLLSVESSYFSNVGSDLRLGLPLLEFTGTALRKPYKETY